MVYVGIYALIYLHTILGEGIVSRDGLPRGVLPSGILKIEKYCPGLKVPISSRYVLVLIHMFTTMDTTAVNTIVKNITVHKGRDAMGVLLTIPVFAAKVMLL